MRLSILIVLSTAMAQMVPFVPNCYTDDIIPRQLDIGVVVDYGISEGKSLSEIKNAVDDVMSVGKIMYKQQLNIVLNVAKLVIGNEKSPLPLSRSNRLGTCTSATAAFEELNLWNQNNYGNVSYWILFSTCFSGITGVSYTGSICGNSNAGVASFDWYNFAHELGHGIGATHTFGSGGIMDYGSGKYNSVVQFNPIQRTEICSFLNYVEARCPKYFRKMSKSEECGDGIVSGTETCECLDRSKKCGACVNCSTKQLCSSKTFVVKRLNDTDVAVTKKALSDSKCCVNGVQAPAMTLCSNGYDVCSEFGTCTKACSNAFGISTKVCGFQQGGCMQGCMFGNKCRYDITVSDSLTSIVKNGTTCSMNGRNGKCESGTCKLNPIVCKNVKLKKNCLKFKCKWKNRKCI